MYSTHDRNQLRHLAGRYAEHANSPRMTENRRLWTALKDLRSERPMFRFDPGHLGEEFVAQHELKCQDTHLRQVEHWLLAAIRRIEEIGDDYTIDPCWRMGWQVTSSGYGVDIGARHDVDASGGAVGYHFDHPIRTPADIDRLVAPTYQVDRAASMAEAERLHAIFGDLLPVVLHGSRTLLSSLTQDLFKLLGNDNLLTWPIDEPDALDRVMIFLRDERLRWFHFLEHEGLLGANANESSSGPGSPGYVSGLPAETPAGGMRLDQTWAWMESQETTTMSPRMFTRQFLPHMAEVAKLFGLVYYGCCEPVHDRWQAIRTAIPNIRAVSVSPWCDQRKLAAMVGHDVVLSRKPPPPLISGDHPDWDGLSADLDETLAATRGCNLEIIYRDVYRINSDRGRLRRWSDLVRARVDAAHV